MLFNNGNKRNNSERRANVRERAVCSQRHPMIMFLSPTYFPTSGQVNKPSDMQEEVGAAGVQDFCQGQMHHDASPRARLMQSPLV